MNKAIFPNDDITIMKQLERIRASAVMDDKYFDEYNYKWCLGIGVISEIAKNTIYYSQDEKRTLFGIAIDIDYHNDFRMELWKNITNDII
jgi:predicted hydrolase (HD superfamily)